MSTSHFYTFARFVLLFGAILVSWSCSAPTTQQNIPRPDASSIDASKNASKTLRKKAADRQRRIIFNNDGNEPVVFCKSTDPGAFLNLRTTPLVGSQVDTIFYCTWSSGFGLFTHDTKVGRIFNTREAMFSNNLAQAFVDQGRDPLRLMVDFCHSNKIEIFWSYRVNDTHDGSSAPYGPVMFRANQLKLDHPEYLLGSKTNRPKYGVWSAVNFSLTEIRELAFRYVEEVCQNYDVDGIELDFFRHPFFFPSTAAGQPCTQAECDQMTSLLQRIRKMADRRALERGRPILIAVRVPDSAEYSKAIGLDLERWLSGDLVDLLIGSGYFQLNPWDYSVSLARKYGVKFYPSLDEPRVRNKDANQMRFTPLAYRGRAMNAWDAGVDGIYLFNFFNPNSSIWRELGDPAKLKTLDRDYFSSVRGVGSKLSLPHQTYQNIPTLTPDTPLKIKPGHSDKAQISVGEKLSSPATLKLRMEDIPSTSIFDVSLNGTSLTNSVWTKPWIEFQLRPDQVRRGTNIVEIKSSSTKTVVLSDLMISVQGTR